MKPTSSAFPPSKSLPLLLSLSQDKSKSRSKFRFDSESESEPESESESETESEPDRPYSSEDTESSESSSPLIYSHVKRMNEPHDSAEEVSVFLLCSVKGIGHVVEHDVLQP